MKPQTTKITAILLFLIMTITTESAYIMEMKGWRNHNVVLSGSLLFVFTILSLWYLINLVAEATRLQHFDEAFQMHDMKLGKYIISGEGEDRKGNHYIIICPIETSVSSSNTIQFKRISRYGIPLYCNKSIAPTRPLGGSYEVIEIVKGDYDGKNISSKYIEPLPQNLETW